MFSADQLTYLMNKRFLTQMSVSLSGRDNQVMEYFSRRRWRFVSSQNNKDSHISDNDQTYLTIGPIQTLICLYLKANGQEILANNKTHNLLQFSGD